MLLRATTCYRLSLAVVVPRVAAKRLYETRFHRRSGTGTRTDTVDTPYRIHTAPLSCRFFFSSPPRIFLRRARACYSSMRFPPSLFHSAPYHFSEPRLPLARCTYTYAPHTPRNRTYANACKSRAGIGVTAQLITPRPQKDAEDRGRRDHLRGSSDFRADRVSPRLSHLRSVIILAALGIRGSKRL